MCFFRKSIWVVLAVAALGGCSVVGGVTGSYLDQGSENQAFSNAFFGVGMAIDDALIKGELDRYRSKQQQKSFEDELKRSSVEGTCDFAKARKVCSALKGCRCVAN